MKMFPWLRDLTTGAAAENTCDHGPALDFTTREVLYMIKISLFVNVL